MCLCTVRLQCFICSSFCRRLVVFFIAATQGVLRLHVRRVLQQAPQLDALGPLCHTCQDAVAVPQGGPRAPHPTLHGAIHPPGARGIHILMFGQSRSSFKTYFPRVPICPRSLLVWTSEQASFRDVILWTFLDFCQGVMGWLFQNGTASVYCSSLFTAALGDDSHLHAEVFFLLFSLSVHSSEDVSLLTVHWKLCSGTIMLPLPDFQMVSSSPMKVEKSSLKQDGERTSHQY